MVDFRVNTESYACVDLALGETIEWNGKVYECVRADSGRGKVCDDCTLNISGGGSPCFTLACHCTDRRDMVSVSWVED
jgi:hypothetical protein